MSDAPEDATPVAQSNDDVVETTPSGDPGIGSRLIIMIVIFLVAAGGIMGYRYYLDSDLPKADPNHIKEKRDPSEIPKSDGATLEAPAPA